MEEPRWTLDELAERVDAALAVDYDGQPSGRVRDVPDRRAIRWYTTIGLIDRPAAHRGRTARYGPRHLLQLVAVKRLQARGLPLVAIQQELAGATDTQLARVARLPDLDPEPAAPRRHPAPVAATAGQAERAGPAPVRAAIAAAGSPPVASRRAAFWRDPPVPGDPANGSPGVAEGRGAPGVAALRGVWLGDGVTVLLGAGRELGPADLRAIGDAARPLLAALRARGLAGGPVTPIPAPPLAGRPEPRREHP